MPDGTPGQLWLHAAEVWAGRELYIIEAVLAVVELLVVVLHHQRPPRPAVHGDVGRPSSVLNKFIGPKGCEDEEGLPRVLRMFLSAFCSPVFPHTAVMARIST